MYNVETAFLNNYFKKEVINNLNPYQVVIDYQEEKLIIKCFDNDKYFKSYYLDFEELQGNITRDIKEVMQKGYKHI